MTYDALLIDLTAFASVVVIDVVLAGDNALVVGLVASRLPHRQQRRVVALGIAVALVCRIGFSVVAAQLLLITGLLFAGGLLLLWVAWKLWREIEAMRRAAEPQLVEASGMVRPAPKTFAAAVWQIALADVSMSLDNVLGVAGAARDHLWMLIFGLVLSISLMGIAATVIAGFMERHHWLSYIGLVVVAYVAVSMIYHGAGEILPLVTIFGQIR
jgi:YjbE family integral membrane protein